MPATLSYPGVYIEEIPSGVRTITGVATSITAFIGRAQRGPVDEPIFINSYADFERTFGGLWEGSTLGFAVRDFYLNGGNQAIIIRLHNNAKKKTFSVMIGDIPVLLEAENPGKWGNELEASAEAVEGSVNLLESLRESFGLAESDKLYTLKVERKKNGQVIAQESFRNIIATNSAHPRYIKNVLKNQSAFVRVSEEGGLPTGGLELNTVDLKKEVKNLSEALGDKDLIIPDTGPPVWPKVSTSIAKIAPILDKVQSQLTNISDISGTKLADIIKNNLEFLENNKELKDLITTIKAPPVEPEELDQVVTKLNEENEAQIKALNTSQQAVVVQKSVTAADGSITSLKQKLTDAKTKIDNAAESDAVKIGVLKAALGAANEVLSAVGASQDGTDGDLLESNSFIGPGLESQKKGLFALEKTDLFNLLCIPPYTISGDIEYTSLLGAVIPYCVARRALYIIDPPAGWSDKAKAKTGIDTEVGNSSKNAAIFFPRLRQPNPLRNNQMDEFVPCGAVAGVFARTDTQRGVWKAPAGLEATMAGVPQLSVALTDLENGELNQKGINCLRSMPAAGRIIWGARTREGDDRLASEWKYIPVRRTALFIEESLYRGTQWVVFEPNDEPLWAQIRLNLGAFMHNLFRQGAFQGTTPRDAYFVKCDKETTTQNDINLGIVNIVVGFAPLKPAEFVVIKLQQMAGQIEV